MQELFRYPCVGVAGLINDHRHQEGRVVRNVQEPPRGEFPLAPEIALSPHFGVR